MANKKTEAPLIKVDEPIEEVTEQPLCKYCNEDLFFRFGRLGTVYTPVDAVYCPICGRKHKPTDRDY